MIKTDTSLKETPKHTLILIHNKEKLLQQTIDKFKRIFHFHKDILGYSLKNSFTYTREHQTLRRTLYRLHVVSLNKFISLDQKAVNLYNMYVFYTSQCPILYLS